MYKFVNIYGDSHCRIFFRDKLKIQKDGISINNKYVSQVSLRGLSNNNSKLNMNNRILNDNIQYSNNNDVLICLKFGQVDLEYVYYYKKYVKKENINIEDFTDELINIYLNFINKLNNKNNILVISTCLPNPNAYLETIQTSIGMSIQVDYTELSKNFNLFNEKLKKMLSINKIFFFDMLPIIGNKIEDYYILKKEYIGIDHHLKGSEWTPILKNQGSEYGKYETQELMNYLLTYIKSL